MMRSFRSIGTALLLPPATPKDRVDIFKEAVRKTHQIRHSSVSTANSPAAMSRRR